MDAEIECPGGIEREIGAGEARSPSGRQFAVEFAQRLQHGETLPATELEALLLPSPATAKYSPMNMLP